MTIWGRVRLGFLTITALMIALSEPTRAFATFDLVWPNGNITMHMLLGSQSRSLIDGSPSWNATATEALNIWNQHLDLVKFAPVQDSSVGAADNDGINQVFFDRTFYGERFGEFEVAITTRWLIDTTLVETDAVFNAAFQWDSYRGSLRPLPGDRTLNDIRRIALHEFGHALGLDHPNERGQSVHALMNSQITSLDSLTTDDIAGAQSMYGAGLTSNVTFPPRNEPNDFFQQLIALYRDRLGAPSVTTYLDPEGAVVWLSEYARYRVGLCDHSVAQARVFAQIDQGVSSGVCAVTPAGGIPFPPRNQGLRFMTALNDKYRQGLGRTATSSFVDNEGAVVWVLEYFRYRLNGCTHGDATTRVFQQILGQGIQPICRV